ATTWKPPRSTRSSARRSPVRCRRPTAPPPATSSSPSSACAEPALHRRPRRCSQVRKPLASHIFLLTRVTRIFEKSVLTKFAPTGLRGALLRAFCCAHARAAVQGVISSRPDKESQTMLFETGEGGKSLKPPAPRRTNLWL